MAPFFGFSRVVTPAQNVVHQRLQRMSYQLPNYTATDLLDFMTYFKAQSMLSTILGEDNPYLESAREDFKLPKMPF